MTDADDLLVRVQDDCHARLLQHAELADVAIIQERRATTEQELAKLLSTLKGRSGKIGVAILVQRPMFYPEADNSSLRGQLVQAFTVIEHPTLNRGSQGTQKTAEALAIEVLRLFHFAACSVPQQTFSALPSGAIIPDDTLDGLNAWEVRLALQVSPGRGLRCGTPLIDPDSGDGSAEVTLTCATSGAAIFYTTDGSYPSSQNEAARKYLVPFAPGAVTLRAAAELDGYQQSSVAQVTFS